MQKIKILNCEIEYNDDNVRIIDSYKITDRRTMRDILFEFYSCTGYVMKRSMNSLILE